MLNAGDTLQGRYRILGVLGKGGMAVVYLTEDARLPGRQCAIKEMSPARVPLQDRNWAIQMFRQEAQMLSQLKHEGLAAVTDLFPERGNWYLVMDYVEGETLEDILDQAPRHCLPEVQVLNIIGQLCDVLEYLHKRNPPVIFRDLKPGNVMITPKREVKLIDFGVARYFKPGRPQDTVNLGTPGYAAPEQYGGKSQSDARSDVYGLGVLLHQMLTGHDPTTTPHALPPACSLNPGIRYDVEQAIVCATQMDAAARFQGVNDFRQAILKPPPPPQPSPPPRRNWVGWLAGLGGGVLGLIGLATVLIVGGVLVYVFTRPIPTPAPPTSGGIPPVSEPTFTPVSAEELVTVIPPTPLSEADRPAPPASQTTPPTSTPEPPPSTSEPPPFRLQRADIGQSVRGRALSVAFIGNDRGSAIVVVGSIQGDQTNTRDLVSALVNYFEQNPQAVPDDVVFHFIPSINPDGNALGSRYNANGVDLNRNWETTDWRSKAAVPGYPDGKAGAGGRSPFSEPETRALRDFLYLVHSRARVLKVVIVHSSVHRSQGEIYPGGDAAVGIASTYASVADYNIETAWAEYTTSGELVTWCEEQGVLSIDVVIPGSQRPTTRVSGSRTLLDITVQALLKIAD